MAKMVTLLLISFSVLALLAIAVYFWQKPSSATDIEILPPAPGRALFEAGTPTGIALAAADAAAQESAATQQLRQELLERAARGQKVTLQEAHAKHAVLYDEVLNALVEFAESDAALLSLASYVIRNNLGVNKNLAEKFIDSSTGRLERGAVAKMLHVAALADDAGIYQKAVERAMESWRKSMLSEVSAQELRAILEGEFWILSASTRSSGAGFLLKRALAGARRELDSTHRE